MRAARSTSPTSATTASARSTPRATSQTVAGDGVGGFNADGLAATATSLNNPTDIAFDAAGNMLIADMRNQRVRRLDAASGTIGTIAGTGQDLSSDDFLPAVTATLKFPTDVAVDAEGNVLIVDSGSNRIRRVSAQGVIDTIVGSRVPGDAGDGGPAAAARLLTPLRITRTAAGGLLIVDHDNHRIRARAAPAGAAGATPIPTARRAPARPVAGRRRPTASSSSTPGSGAARRSPARTAIPLAIATTRRASVRSACGSAWAWPIRGSRSARRRA